MDRFKFRVWNNRDWDNDFGKVYYDAEKTYDYLGGNPNIPASSFGNLVESDEWILEQCTGLKDKNDKLIYEGDILEIKWNNDDYPRYYQVKFEDGAFGIEPLECNDWLDSEYISDISQETLIIGNIHENKDLLEDK